MENKICMKPWAFQEAMKNIVWTLTEEIDLKVVDKNVFY